MPKTRNTYTEEQKTKWREAYNKRTGTAKEAHQAAQKDGYKGGFDSYKALVTPKDKPKAKKSTSKGPGRPKGAKNKSHRVGNGKTEDLLKEAWIVAKSEGYKYNYATFKAIMSKTDYPKQLAKQPSPILVKTIKDLCFKHGLINIQAALDHISRNID